MRAILLAAALLLAGCPGKGDAPASGAHAGGAPAGGAHPDAAPAGSEPARDAMTPADPPARPRPVLVCVGETLGWVEPCGCTEGMLGGVARRAAFLAQLRARGYDPIVLDLGDLVDTPGRQAELKLEALAEAYDRMQVAFLATGERDLDFAPAIARLEPANMEPAPAPPPAIERPDLPRPLRVAALLSTTFAADLEIRRAGARLTDPALAKGDVLLFHGPRDEARRLFADREDVLLVFAGHNEEIPAPAERLPGGAWLVSAGDKGKFATVVEIRAEEGGAIALRPWAPEPLDDRVPDDPEVLRIVESYKQRLHDENLVAALPKAALESGGFFVGAETCGACHKPQLEAFKKMKHAHAYESLLPRKGERNPECLRCHVTGFGFETGFAGIEETPRLANVSCESCHGVGSNHIANPRPGFGAIKEPARLCVRCHDRENSPRFDFPTYWEKIKH